MITNTANNFIKRVKNVKPSNAFPKNLVNSLIRKNHNEKSIEPKDDVRIYKSMMSVPHIAERIKNDEIYNKDRFTLGHTSENTLKTSRIDKILNANCYK